MMVDISTDRLILWVGALLGELGTKCKKMSQRSDLMGVI